MKAQNRSTSFEKRAVMLNAAAVTRFFLLLNFQQKHHFEDFAVNCCNFRGDRDSRLARGEVGIYSEHEKSVCHKFEHL